MFRACLAFAFALVITLASTVNSQSNSQRVSQPPGAQVLPPDTRDSMALDSAKDAAKAKRKSKADAKAAAKSREKAIADSTKAAKKATTDSSTAAALVPATVDSAKSSAPTSVSTPPAGTALPDSSKAAAPDTENSAVASDTNKTPAALDNSVQAPILGSGEPGAVTAVRQPQDLRLFNDPSLMAKEYGFGIMGSVVAGALGFYIGSGIETAFEGERNASKGTLTFTGIRYDNYKGAFWGGASGMVLGSALTTYFIGQMDEEDGGFFMTLAGTAAAAGGAFYVAHLMGVNDEIDWKPFVPLLAIPSLGGTLGFNVSRLFHDHQRERIVGKQASASIWLRPPSVAWGRDQGGDRLEIKALHLTF